MYFETSPELYGLCWARCSHFGRWGHLNAEFYSLHGMSILESVVLRSVKRDSPEPTKCDHQCTLEQGYDLWEPKVPILPQMSFSVAIKSLLLLGQTFSSYVLGLKSRMISL